MCLLLAFSILPGTLTLRFSPPVTNGAFMSVRRLIIGSFIALLLLTGCSVSVPTIKRREWVVYRGADGFRELLRVGFDEPVPPGPIELGVRPVDIGAPGGFESVSRWLGLRRGYFVRRDIKAFAAGGRGSRIYRLTAGREIPVGVEAFEIESPGLSAAGKEIVFSCREYEGDPWHIWTMQADGSQPRFICAGRQPSWSGAGRIVFARQGGIWASNTDGTALQQLVPAGPDYVCLQPAPAPDGKRLAYVRGRKSMPASRDVWIRNLTTGTDFRLTANPSRDDLPRWSADGKQVFFRSTRGQNWGVWRAAPTPR